MDLINAIVNVHTNGYEGPVLVLRSNGDDIMTVRSELTGHEFSVHKDDFTLAPVTEQPLEWVAERLFEAWEPFLRRLARHLAERLQRYVQFGETEYTNAIFQSYLDDPGKAFRELCQRRL